MNILELHGKITSGHYEKEANRAEFLMDLVDTFKCGNNPLTPNALKMITLSGGTDYEKATLFQNLHRYFLEPVSAWQSAATHRYPLRDAVDLLERAVTMPAGSKL